MQQQALQHDLARDAAMGQKAKDQLLNKALALAKLEKLPTTPDEAHVFLQEQVGQGEMLFKAGMPSENAFQNNALPNLLNEKKIQRSLC